MDKIQKVSEISKQLKIRDFELSQQIETLQKEINDAQQIIDQQQEIIDKKLTELETLQKEAENNRSRLEQVNLLSRKLIEDLDNHINKHEQQINRYKIFKKENTRQISTILKCINIGQKNTVYTIIYKKTYNKFMFNKNK